MDRLFVKEFYCNIVHAGVKVPFSLLQQVRVSSLSDDLHKMRIRTRRNVFFIAVMILHSVQAAPQRRVPAAASPCGENFDICGHSGFVGSSSDLTLRARGRGEGRANGAERDVVGAAGRVGAAQRGAGLWWTAGAGRAEREGTDGAGLGCVARSGH